MVTIQREGDEMVPCNKLMEVDHKMNILHGLFLDPVCEPNEPFWSYFESHKNLILFSIDCYTATANFLHFFLNLCRGDNMMRV